MVFFLQTRLDLRHRHFVLNKQLLLVSARLLAVALLPLLVLLQGCTSSLDVNDGNRKEIPLDPPNTLAHRIAPDSSSFAIYLTYPWDSRQVLLHPIEQMLHVRIDTGTAVPLLWIKFSGTFDDTLVTAKSVVPNAKYRITSLRLQMDSLHSQQYYECKGAPSAGTGTSVRLLHLQPTGTDMDSLTIIPPHIPANVQSIATLSLSYLPQSPNNTKQIVGTYKFTATLFDPIDQQTITVPVEGIFTAYYH